MATLTLLNGDPQPDQPNTGNTASSGYVFWFEEYIRTENREILPSKTYPEDGSGDGICWRRIVTVHKYQDFKIFRRHKFEAEKTRSVWFYLGVAALVVGAIVVTGGVAVFVAGATAATTGAVGGIAGTLAASNIGTQLIIGGVGLAAVGTAMITISAGWKVGQSLWVGPEEETPIGNPQIIAVPGLKTPMDCPPGTVIR